MQEKLKRIDLILEEFIRENLIIVEVNLVIVEFGFYRPL